MIVRYGEFKSEFKIQSLAKKYKKTTLHQHGVDYINFENSVSNASKMLLKYRSRIARLERINMTILILGFIFTVAGSIVGGTLYHWVTSLILMFAYFMIASISYFIFKSMQNRQLRQGHFVLAMFCRAENNRFYLSKNVEMRPGFLASWIEFLIHDPPPDEEEPDFDNDWLLKKIQ
jgi:hypothetical protein